MNIGKKPEWSLERYNQVTYRKEAKTLKRHWRKSNIGTLQSEKRRKKLAQH